MLEGVTEVASLEDNALGIWATLELIEQTRRFAGDIPSSEQLCESVRENSECRGVPDPGYPYRLLAAQSALVVDEFDLAAGDGL